MTTPGSGNRKVGLFIATALVVGNMVGSGVFLLPSSLAPFGGISLLGWLFTSAGAAVVALLLAGLARRLPRAGGPYAFTREGLGRLPAFLVAWGYWISIWSGNAAISVAFVGYLAAFHPPLAQSPALGAGTALAAVWFLTGVNALGVREAGIVQVLTTVLKLLPLLAVGTLGLLFLNPDHFVPFNPSAQPTVSAVTATATLTLWAFVGLESATIPADSVKNPARTIPRATVLGTLVAALVYVLATVGVMGALPAGELAGSTAPFADAAARMWGGWARPAVAFGAAVSAFGALNGWILLQGQMPLAAARDGLFPGVFGKVSRRGTPVAGLVISSVLVTGLMALNFTASLVDQFTFIILLATLSTLIPYIFSSLAELAMVARERMADEGPAARGSGAESGAEAETPPGTGEAWQRMPPGAGAPEKRTPPETGQAWQRMPPGAGAPEKRTPPETGQAWQRTPPGASVPERGKLAGPSAASETDPSARESWRARAVLALLALAYSVWASVGAGTTTLFWGLVLLLAGLPVYGWQVWRRKGCNP
jgi:APA family basic amino acid/polyamine antiporter